MNGGARAAGMRLLLGFVALASAGARVTAQEDAALAGNEGLVCTLESVAGGARDARIVDRVALHVPDGGCVSDLLPAGPFRATWRGVLQLDLRSKLRFSARGRGHARLTLGGKVVFDGGGDDLTQLATEEARFDQGANEFLFEYASPPSGEVTLRLLWAGRGFDWEPVPTALFRHAPELEPGDLLALRRGREIVAERRCLRCHPPDPEPDHGPQSWESIARQGMPELTAAAPDLRNAGARLRRDWIAHWIVAPTSLRPTARMPRLLGAGDLAAHLAAGDARALDVAAYVASLRVAPVGEAAAEAPAPETSRIEQGGVLFAQLGCIACHTRPDRTDRADDSRVPLQHVAWKWQPAALVRFLRNPAADDPWIRMPDLHLEENEASAIAAFLLDRSAKNAEPSTPAGGDALRGEELFVTLGCRQCHETMSAPRPVAPGFRAIAQGNWSGRGCAAAEGKRAASCPDFGFTAADRIALQGLGARELASLWRRSAVDFAERQIRELQCNACHTIGVRHDRWQLLMSETSDLLARTDPPTLDQSRPTLTWVGEKLHTDWMRRLIAGEIPERTRPWLLARMPSFPARAELLAKGLAERDGFAASASRPEAADATARSVGEKLLFESGFSCVSCHDIGARKALSRFEFGTPNLALEHARIQPDYYLRWMLNPMRVEPSSKMPRYVDDEGRSPFLEYFDGDIHRQFEAVRLFLAELDPGRSGR